MATMVPAGSVCDVARCILQQLGSMSPMKLQKLVYYCQAWSLVWDERPMFGERIEAWSSGPVVSDLYAQHRGEFVIDKGDIAGDPDKLDPDAKATVAAVLDFYGDKSAQWLSDLTHRENPWREARNGLPDGARSQAEITLAAMEEYYSSLKPDGEEG
ncbi:MAG: type II toxin-antitoxin system antitoxin SocA domain-containing protein [Bacillota bacterium]